MITTESLQVFQYFEQLKLLVSVREDSRVSGQQVGEWTECPTLTPASDQAVECLKEIKLHRLWNAI
jgi:hypothetical protein